MHRLSSQLAAAVLLVSTGCASFFHLDDYTTADETTDGGPAPPLTNEAGQPILPDGAVIPEASVPGCKTNAECNASDANPVVCVKTTGACMKLTTAECPRVGGDWKNDDAVILGALLGGEGAGGVALEHAAFLAAEEISKAGRPIVVLACETSAKMMDASRHLVDDLHVPAIIGPIAADDVVLATQQVSAKGNSLLMTPTALASSIAQLADEGLTWRDVPADGQRAKLVIQQMNELENVIHVVHATSIMKLGIVHRADAVGTSARDAIGGKLIVNGHFIGDPANAGNVSDDAYAKPTDKAGMDAIVSKYATVFKPDVVYLTSPEQIEGVLVPLEAALTAARAVNRPYYVMTDAAKTKSLVDLVTGGSLPTDIKRRIRGVGVRPDTTSSPVLAAFEAAYTARWTTAPTTTDAAFAYDATYAVTYATLADDGKSGASVAKGLRALGVGEGFAVGAKDTAAIVQRLAKHQSVSLRGTFSLMQWDAMGDIAAGTLEVWCLGASGFGSSGLTMDVQTQVIGGSFVQCQ